MWTGPFSRLDGPFDCLGSFLPVFCMKWSPYALSLLVFVSLPFVESLRVLAQPGSAHDAGVGERGTAEEPHHGHRTDSWEGVAEGVAYSQFNHRFVGFLVLLFGLAELGPALQYSWPLWIRLVLPCALGVVAVFLLVWSDHEAWPIGPLGFAETFFGQDMEIVQHKLYGVLAGAAAISETLRRIDRVRHPVWAAPLIFYGMIGGLLLFIHSHGSHPGNGRIEFHHAIMGSLGVGAALSRAVFIWKTGSSSRSGRVWDILWAAFIILMGMQLLLYSE